MEKVKLIHKKTSESIKSENRSEFISKATDKWTYENELYLIFSRLGKIIDNVYNKSFNGYS